MKNLGLAVLVALLLGLYLNWGELRRAFGPQLQFTEEQRQGVVMYSTDWCGYCRRMRTFFRTHNIDYREYDIEKSPRGKAEYDQLAGHGIPLVVVRGNVVRGYNPNKVAELLGLQTAR